MTLTRQKGELPEAYEPQKVEGRIYQFWLKKGYFTPKIDHNKKPFRHGTLGRL
jgi:valyl-tRNA synthetase